jgi:hypothetical protein
MMAEIVKEVGLLHHYLEPVDDPGSEDANCMPE